MWKKMELKDCCIGKGEYGISPKPVEYSGKLPAYLRITDINERGKFIHENKKSIIVENEKEYLLKQGDIVFARTGSTVGKSYLYDDKDGKLIHAGYLIKFRPNPEILLSKYLSLYTETQSYWNWVKTNSSRSGQPGLNAEEYSKMILNVPSTYEQRAIIEVLDVWENAIEKIEHLIHLKKEYKKGLMQKLLKGDGKYKKLKKNKVVQKLKGIIKEVSKRNTLNKIKLVLSVTNSHGFRQQSDHFDRVVASKDLGNYKIVSKGQFGYNPSRINVGSIAILKDFENGLLSPMYVIFKTDESKLLSEYMEYFIQTWAFNGQVDYLTQGSVRDSLGFDSLEQIEIYLPTIEEQRKIVEVFELIDKELEFLIRQEAILILQKKGIMQRILAGKIRVRVKGEKNNGK